MSKADQSQWHVTDSRACYKRKCHVGRSVSPDRAHNPQAWESEPLAMAGNTNLAHAKAACDDEFYTQLPDIERELHHYRRHFRGKVGFCNCDDPFESNFFKYFVLNFNRLGRSSRFIPRMRAGCCRRAPWSACHRRCPRAVPRRQGLRAARCSCGPGFAPGHPRHRRST